MLINVLWEHIRVMFKPHVPIQMMDLIANVILASWAMDFFVLTSMNATMVKMIVMQMLLVEIFLAVSAVHVILDMLVTVKIAVISMNVH